MEIYFIFCIPLHAVWQATIASCHIQIAQVNDTSYHIMQDNRNTFSTDLCTWGKQVHQGNNVGYMGRLAFLQHGKSRKDTSIGLQFWQPLLSHEFIPDSWETKCLKFTEEESLIANLERRGVEPIIQGGDYYIERK